MENTRNPLTCFLRWHRASAALITTFIILNFTFRSTFLNDSKYFGYTPAEQGTMPQWLHFLFIGIMKVFKFVLYYQPEHEL